MLNFKLGSRRLSKYIFSTDICVKNKCLKSPFFFNTFHCVYKKASKAHCFGFVISTNQESSIVEECALVIHGWELLEELSLSDPNGIEDEMRNLP